MEHYRLPPVMFTESEANALITAEQLVLRYRNLDRNWHLLADVNPIIQQPTLMIHAERDVIPQFPQLGEFVPNVETVSLDCGHWIQQEKPEETNAVILDWLART